MQYADVILPLGFDGLYTYSIPPALKEKVKPFVRVIVPLGKSQTYTGVVAVLHDNNPATKTDSSGKSRCFQLRSVRKP